MNNEFIEKPYVPTGFKYWKQGWYSESSVNKPKDAIKVPQGEYEAIMDGQAKGLQISENAGGYPILIGTLPTLEDLAKQRTQMELQQKVQPLKAELQASDYKAIKFAEGQISASDYEPIKQARQALRDKINALEGSAL